MGVSGKCSSGGNSSGMTCGSSCGTSGFPGSEGWLISGVGFGAGISGCSFGKVSCCLPIVFNFDNRRTAALFYYNKWQHYALLLKH